jgi:hypothetical protein
VTVVFCDPLIFTKKLLNKNKKVGKASSLYRTKCPCQRTSQASGKICKLFRKWKKSIYSALENNCKKFTNKQVYVKIIIILFKFKGGTKKRYYSKEESFSRRHQKYS